MNKLPAPLRIIGLLLGIILIFFLITQISRCQHENPPTVEPRVEDISPLPPTPDLPARDTIRRGVVEMGAKGFNFFVVKMDASNNWELLEKEFGSSLVYERMATPASIILALKEYISKIVNYRVAGKDIHFIVGSGARKDERSAKIEQALKELGYVVNVVTPEEEARYAFKSAINRAYLTEGFVVDIGSGNTKIAWLDQNGKIQGLETYGAKYYQDEVDDEAVNFHVRSQVRQIPENRRSICFIIGGIPYEMATKEEEKNGPEKKEEDDKDHKIRYTLLQQPSAYVADGDFRFASGQKIYNALYQESGCKKFVFDWDANFSIGFLLDL